MPKSRKGFTLIELLIVVAVLGILAVIAIPKFADLVIRSREARVKSVLGTVRSAISVYYGDTQGYPADLEVALATDHKYLKEFPTIEIPSVPRLGTPGHAPSNVVSTTQNDWAGGGYYYAGSANDGGVFINCNHIDSKSSNWSGY